MLLNSLKPCVARLSAASSVRCFSSHASADQGHSLYVWGGGAGRSLSNLNPFASKGSSPLDQLHLRPQLQTSPDDSGFRDIAFGHVHAAFVTGKGNLYTYGRGPALGHGADVQEASTPRLVEGLPPIAEVRCGEKHTIALSRDGEVFTFGSANPGFFSTSPLGREGGDSSRPGLVTIGDNNESVVQVAAGSKHCTVRTKSGLIYAWGSGENGRLGVSDSSGRKAPELVPFLDFNIIAHISSGSSFNGALDVDGSVFMWGRNEKGQLGVGAGMTLDQYSMESEPALVSFEGSSSDGDVKISKLACAYKHTLAIDRRGRLFMWGRSFLSPNLMTGNDGDLKNIVFKDVAGGNDFSVAVADDGCLLTWGDGSRGCLGHANNASQKQPLHVRGFGPSPQDSGVDSADKWFGRAIRVFAGHNHCAALVTK